MGKIRDPQAIACSPSLVNGDAEIYLRKRLYYLGMYGSDPTGTFTLTYVLVVFSVNRKVVIRYTISAPRMALCRE